MGRTVQNSANTLWVITVAYDKCYSDLNTEVLDLRSETDIITTTTTTTMHRCGLIRKTRSPSVEQRLRRLTAVVAAAAAATAPTLQ